MNQETLVFIVPEDSKDLRLDIFLSKQSQIGTRNRASKLIENKSVSIDNGPTKASYRVQQGQKIYVVLKVIQDSSELVPYPIKLDIVFEDDDLLVVNKPSGLVVHPAAGHKDQTLVNALIHNVKNLSMGFQENRPGIVHRIDKDTSGLLVVAKNDFSHEALAQQFKDKSIHRIYWAIVFGQWPINKVQGTIQSNISRHPKDRKKFSSLNPIGKNAVTHFKLIDSSSSGLSLLHLKLETGRTHQIRVHLSEEGFPLVADWTYCKTSQLKRIPSVEMRALIKRMNRFALHASEIGFKHPKKNTFLKFKCDWPENLVQLVESAYFNNAEKEVEW